MTPVLTISVGEEVNGWAQYALEFNEEMKPKQIIGALATLIKGLKDDEALNDMFNIAVMHVVAEEKGNAVS